MQKQSDKLQLKTLPYEHTEQFYVQQWLSGEEYWGMPTFDNYNYPDDKIFPYPQYVVGFHCKDDLPPLFYVYHKRTAMAFDLRTYELVGIKRKGRNPKTVKYILKHIHKWLNMKHPLCDNTTYGEDMRTGWFNDEWRLTEDGQLMTYAEWEKWMREHEENEEDLPPITDYFDYEAYEKIGHYVDEIPRRKTPNVF